MQDPSGERAGDTDSSKILTTVVYDFSKLNQEIGWKNALSVCFPDSLREALDPTQAYPTQIYPSCNSTIIFTARPQVLKEPNKDRIRIKRNDLNQQDDMQQRTIENQTLRWRNQVIQIEI